MAVPSSRDQHGSDIDRRESNATLPKSSLLICTRNRPEMLLDTVRSVLNGRSVPTELIIVDQSDRTNEDIATLSSRTCEIRYFWAASAGLSRARNEGIRKAKYEIVVFTDDDVLVPETWYDTIVGAIVEAGARGIVTGRVLPEEQAGDGFVPSLMVDPEPAEYKGRIYSDILYTHNAGMHRSLAERIGGFDERMGPGTKYPGAEDNDFAFRALEEGFRILYVPSAALYHRAWRPFSQYLPLRWNYGRGQGAYYGKHIDLRDRYMLRRMLWETQHLIGRGVRRIGRDRRRGFGDFMYVLGMLSGFLQWRLMEGRT